MNRGEKRFVRLVWAFLLIGVVIWCSMGLYSSAEVEAFEKKSYTITTSDSHYSETTYYYNAQEFVEQNSEIGTIASNFIDENEELFVAGIREHVMVEEKYLDGVVAESRLLTREEINEEKDCLRASAPVLGADRMSRYELDILIYIMHGSTMHGYNVFGQATWGTQVILGGEELPDAGADDFMIINWGGDGELKAIDRSFSGKYWGGAEVEYSLNIQNAYQGYSWQFREKVGAFGPCLQSANAMVELAKTYSEEKDKETNVQLTYVHTYGSITPTIGISAGYPSGVAGSVSVSSTDKAWQIMGDVPGLTY